jgi:hypothetical protein
VAFKRYVAVNNLKHLAGIAYAYVLEQCDKWKKEDNAKLSERYRLLKEYFDRNEQTWKADE